MDHRRWTVGLILLAGLSFCSEPTKAQVPGFPQTLPPNTVVGRLGTGPGPSQAIPFSTLATQVLGSATNITINQPAGPTLQQGLVINQAVPLVITGNVIQGAQITTGDNGGAATGINGSGYAYNHIFITGDSRADYGTSPYTYGARVYMQTGGAAARGSKIAFGATIYRFAPDNTAQAYGDTIAGNFLAQSNFGDGGTDTGGGARGTLFGLGVGANAGNGTTNLLLISGAEVDVGIDAGASVAHRFGWQVVDNGALSAAHLDIGYEVGSISTAPGFKIGWAITKLHGGQGIATTGTIIGTDGNAITVAKGIDWTSVTFTGNVITTSNFVVNAAGSITATQILATNAVGTAMTTGIPAGGLGGMGFVASTTANFGTFFGSGAPTMSAAQGSHYLRSDGSPITRAYVNTNGTTGWITLISADVVPVGSLPTCNAGSEGARLAVNDSNAASFTAGIGTIVAAGGTTHVPVYCDKTNWRIG